MPDGVYTVPSPDADLFNYSNLDYLIEDFGGLMGYFEPLEQEDSEEVILNTKYIEQQEDNNEN